MAKAANNAVILLFSLLAKKGSVMVILYLLSTTAGIAL